MFPMRSKTDSRLILSACVAIVPALASCGSETGEGGDSHDRSQIASNAAAIADASTKAAPDIPRAAPVTDSLHFDLECDVQGRTVSDANPQLSHGTYPANVRTWRYHTHLIVDLEAMQACDASVCQDYGLFPIASATPDRITFYDQPGLTDVISRRNWRYEQRQESMGRVDVTRGQCTRAAFSGFPPRQAG